MVNSKGDIIFGAALEGVDARQMRRKEAERTYRKKAPNEPEPPSAPAATAGGREGVRERRARLGNGDIEEQDRGTKRDRNGAVKAQNVPVQSMNSQIDLQEPSTTVLSMKLDKEQMFTTRLDGGYYPVDPVLNYPNPLLVLCSPTRFIHRRCWISPPNSPAVSGERVRERGRPAQRSGRRTRRRGRRSDAARPGGGGRPLRSLPAGVGGGHNGRESQVSRLSAGPPRRRLELRARACVCARA